MGELLQELWRILTPGGRIIVVAPNRRGLWARMDTTPFGHGQPFSRSQLKALMRQALFSPEGWAEILYVPPLRNRFLLQSAVAWERVGIGFSLPFAGLHVVDATKQLYRAIAVRPMRRAARLSPVFAPAPATRIATLSSALAGAWNDVGAPSFRDAPKARARNPQTPTLREGAGYY